MWRTAIALVPIAALLGGCGSDGSEPLSRDRLVQRANEICAERIREIERLEEGLDPTDDEAATRSQTSPVYCLRSRTTSDG